MRKDWCRLALTVGLLLTPATAALGGQPAFVPPMNFYFDRQPPPLPPNQFDSGSGRVPGRCERSYSAFERTPDACRTGSNAPCRNGVVGRASVIANRAAAACRAGER